MADAIVFSLFLVSASPSLGGDYGAAADTARRAYLLTEDGRNIKDRVDKYGKYIVHDYLGLEKEDVIYVIWAVPLVSGRLSTKPFKGLRWKGKSWSLQPEVEYKLSGDNKFTGELVFNYTF
jgi:hypothetical protein